MGSNVVIFPVDRHGKAGVSDSAQNEKPDLWRSLSPKTDQGQFVGVFQELSRLFDGRALHVPDNHKFGG